MEKLLKQIGSNHPHISLVEGDHFYWSPKNQQIMYATDPNYDNPEVTLLHELSHALLEHKTFLTDFQLLLMEAEAWEKAVEIGKTYGVTISEDHIQDCLDTYRDWLYMRSMCPSCGTNSVQDSSRTYQCFNCSTSWDVSSSRLCRPYRRTK